MILIQPLAPGRLNRCGVMEKRRLSVSAIVLIIFIFTSTLFANKAVEVIDKFTGGKGVEILLVLSVVTLFAALCIMRSRPILHDKKAVILIFAVLSGIILAWQIENPAERVHIIEYGLLGWILSRDLAADCIKTSCMIKALLLCIIVGTIDELLQYILPYRIFDVRDIIFNGMGGFWGIITYILGRDF